MTPTSTFQEVYVQYHPQVLRYITWRILDKEDARDLAHDVFLRLLEYAPAQYQSDLRFLIFRIANNVVNSYLRRYYVRKEYADDCVASASMSDATVDILPEIYSRDLSLLEQSIVSRLPEKRRAVYSLRRYQEKTADEIAQILSLSRRTVDTHLYLAFKVMRTKMKDVI
ncbi:sigma-70 family RNA polymerase sigma factor [uncultured Muribaculum sp.]|uniref:sigma-70 family RNA polymerase sigma factor n=1 Tax=uncultured Muribaculum sp. TaxID=1918613 RepID=UPI0025D0E831|nr:sigma-70 family RNA polymerase sigma factor [uncultured Muribaculum sp.]